MSAAFWSLRAEQLVKSSAQSHPWGPSSRPSNLFKVTQSRPWTAGQSSLAPLEAVLRAEQLVQSHPVPSLDSVSATHRVPATAVPGEKIRNAAIPLLKLVTSWWLVGCEGGPIVSSSMVSGFGYRHHRSPLALKDKESSKGPFR